MNDLGKFKRYRIGQAAKALGVKTSVLRFWEGEFPQLEPVRTDSGQRLYTEDHMSLLRCIKALLYDEGLTIEGARKRLEDGEPAEPSLPVALGPVADTPVLREVTRELRSILALLGSASKG